MLFAAYPSPSGYTPPPKRSANPLVIVLSICGGCALIAIIGTVIAVVIGSKQPFTQRLMATGQFMAAIKGHNYTAAEAQLTGEARANYPAAKLQQIEEGLEQKYGPLDRFNQGGLDMGDQRNPNSLQEITYKLQYQSGKSTITLNFTGVAQQPGKITGLMWDAEGSSNNSDSGGSSGAGTDEKPKKKHGAHKGSADSGSGE